MAALLGDAFDLDLTAQEVERTLAVAGYTDTGRVAAMLVGDKEVEATAFPSGTWAAKHLVYNVHGWERRHLSSAGLRARGGHEPGRSQQHGRPTARDYRAHPHALLSRRFG